MGEFDVRFRQIHLDFHTSEFIDGIGSQFDPEEFSATLEKARVERPGLYRFHPPNLTLS